jgi:uncharacterized membrane protein
MSESINPLPFNIGAIIGAIIGVVLSMVFLFSTNWDFGRRDVKFSALFPVVGYVIGSFAWDWTFPKKEA